MSAHDRTAGLTQEPEGAEAEHVPSKVSSFSLPLAKALAGRQDRVYSLRSDWETTTDLFIFTRLLHDSEG